MKKRDSVIKKSLATVLVVSTVCTSASCGMLNPSLKAKKEAADIFELLKDEDTRKLNKYFSEDVRDSHDLNDEWEVFFDSIDGDIVSYGEIKSGGESEHSDFGKITFYEIVITIKDVKTDTGMEYEYISYNQIRIDKKHPEREGIGVICVSIPSDDDDGCEQVCVGENIIYYD